MIVHNFSHRYTKLIVVSIVSDKTFSIKDNHEQNITLPSSIAHVFFNIITAKVVNALKDSHAPRPLPSIKSSHELPNIIETLRMNFLTIQMIQ